MFKTTDKQEMFSLVHAEICSQGTASSNKSNCLYLSENGNKCAVGHLLTPEALEIATKLESSTVLPSYTADDVANEFYGDQPQPEEVSDVLQFANELQVNHDDAAGVIDEHGDAAFIIEFTKNMLITAQTHKLEMPDGA